MAAHFATPLLTVFSKPWGRWFWTFAALHSLLAGNLSAAEPSKPPAATPQILHVGNSAEPETIAPYLTTGAPDAQVVDAIFAGLFTYNPLTLKPEPDLVESWTLSKDKTVYTFTLRPQLRWSDGVPLVAEDVAWSWRRALTPTTAAAYAYHLYPLKNGEAFHKGKINNPSAVGVKALNDRTLEVTLEHPTHFFLELLAFYTTFPVPRHVVSKFSDSEWTRPKNIVSSGAFKLAKWETNHYIQLVHNPTYWNASKVRLQEVFLYPTENGDTEEKSFWTGKLHITASVPALRQPYYMDLVHKKSTAPEAQAFHMTPILGVYFYRFNVKRKPLDNPKVRRALAMTIDRRLIVDYVAKSGLPAMSFTPLGAGSYVFQGKTPLVASVTEEVTKEASRLLTEAGYPGGKGIPVLPILYNTRDEHKKIALAVQQMWKKIGIKTELVNQEWKVFLNSQTHQDYTIARYGWIADYPDPNTFLDLWVSNGGNNLTGWSHPTYDQLIRQAGEAPDQETRFKFFQKAEEILLEEMPIAPVYFNMKTRLVSPKVKIVDPASGELLPWRGNVIDRVQFKHYTLSP